MNKIEMVDARGLSCPQPVILTKKALEKNGGKAVIAVDNPVSRDNIKAFAESRDLKVSIKEDGDDYILTIG